MKRSTLHFLAILCLSCVTLNSTEAPLDQLLIDDFSGPVSALGTRWEGFTDRVMGGVSDMNVGMAIEDGRSFLTMSGNVSLKNNGGFIQARLMLREKGNSSFDASHYKGIRLVARGKDEGYYVFLKTTLNLLPWSFYMAPIPLSGDWTEIRLPFSAFTKGDFGALAPLDLKRLASVAVVAYKKEFSARLDLREIGLY